MADIAAVLGRLAPNELEELRERGPHGHLSRQLVEALDRAAGGPGQGRGFYVPTGRVSGRDLDRVTRQERRWGFHPGQC